MCCPVSLHRNSAWRVFLSATVQLRMFLNPGVLPDPLFPIGSAHEPLPEIQFFKHTVFYSSICGYYTHTLQLYRSSTKQDITSDQLLQSRGLIASTYSCPNNVENLLLTGDPFVFCLQRFCQVHPTRKFNTSLVQCQKLGS